MSERTVTCVELVCDDCGNPYQCDGATLHFRPGDPRPDEWESIDGKDVCDECVERRTCASEGHVWGEWMRPCWTPPGVPPEEHRDCRCCIEGETRLLIAERAPEGAWGGW